MPFSPELAEDLAGPVVEVYAEAERILLGRIARSLEAGVDAPGWAESKLLEVQLLQRHVAADLVGANAVATAQLAVATAKAWNRGTAIAEADVARSVLGGLRAAVPLQDSLEAITLEAVGSLQKLHQRTLRAVPDAYREVVRSVAPQVLTGLYTQREAAQHALDKLAATGLTGFTDAAGRNWKLDTYAEMATRTACTRAAVDGHMARLAGRGFNLVMVEDIPQECEVCRPFEGKVFSLDGRGIGADGPAIMTLDQARAEGLFHPGCRHATALYQPGITKLPTHTADPDGDAARQKLRYLERRVRAAKRREAVALDPAAAKRARADVRREQARIRDHVASTPAKRQPHREQLRTARPVAGDPFARDTDEQLQNRLMAEFEKPEPDEKLIERIGVQMDLRDKYAGTDLSEHYRRRNTVLDDGFEGQSDEEIGELIEQAIASGDPDAGYFINEAHLELRNRAYSGKSIHRAVVKTAAPRAQSKAARLRAARADYDTYLESQRKALEDATNGNLIRRDRLAEWREKHGGTSELTMMLEGDPRTAFAYASQEVRDYFESHDRLTFAEYAVGQGISDAALEEQAGRARRRRLDAMRRAEYRRR